MEGKVAVITGGNSGIGLAIAKVFVEEGAFVFITGRRKEQLDEAIAEIGSNAFAVPADSSRLTDLDRLYATVKEKKGRVDIVGANAGILEYAPLGRRLGPDLTPRTSTHISPLPAPHREVRGSRLQPRRGPGPE